MRRTLMNSLLYFPSRHVAAPGRHGPPVEDVALETEDGQRLHGWWTAAARPARAHVLLCHGNAGNIAGRLVYARLLVDAGFDVLLFDYRGYGRSSGRPSEQGTYLDARAALRALLSRDEVDADRVLFFGESLGGAVALELACHRPPAGLILQSAFTGVREMARAVYPFIPRALVPDAYPSLRLIRDLRSPLLVLHGERDEIVPLSHGQALHDAASAPKRLEVLAGVRHNDLLVLAADRWLAAIVAWCDDVAGLPPRPVGR